MIEQNIIVSRRDASAHPESLLAAVQVYQAQQNAAGETSHLPDLRKERAALEAALRRIEQKEAITIQVQIAGIATGASPNAYAAIFAEADVVMDRVSARRQSVGEGVCRFLKVPSREGAVPIRLPDLGVVRVQTDPLESLLVDVRLVACPLELPGKCKVSRRVIQVTHEKRR